jgi:hypothetical protein
MVKASGGTVIRVQGRGGTKPFDAIVLPCVIG